MMNDNLHPEVETGDGRSPGRSVGNESIEDCLGLPKNFHIGKAAGRGDCFFDSMAQVLKATGLKDAFSSKSLRLFCKTFAEQQDPPQWFSTHIHRTHSLEDYAAAIQITAADSESEGILEGRPEVEGRIICGKYGVKLHCIEKQTVGDAIVWCHSIVDATGSRSETPTDYADGTMLHIINLGSHFRPILRGKMEGCLQQDLQNRTSICHAPNLIFPPGPLEDVTNGRKCQNGVDASKEFQKKMYFSIRNLYEVEKSKKPSSKSYLLEDFYDDHFTRGTNAIIAACKYNQSEILDYTLSCDYPAKATDTDRDGATAFHHAIYAGNVQSLQKLLRRWPMWPLDNAVDLQIQAVDDILEVFCRKFGFERKKIPLEMQVFLEEELNWKNFLHNVARMIHSHNTLNGTAVSPEDIVQTVLQAIDTYENNGEKPQHGSNVFHYRLNFLVLSLVAEHFQKLLDHSPAEVHHGLLREPEVYLFQLLLPFVNFHRMKSLEEEVRNFKSDLLFDGHLYEKATKDKVQECGHQLEEIRHWFADKKLGHSQRRLLIGFRSSMETLAKELKKGGNRDLSSPRNESLFWLHGITILDALVRYIELAQSVNASKLQMREWVIERIEQVLGEWVRFTKQHGAVQKLSSVHNLQQLLEISKAKSQNGNVEHANIGLDKIKVEIAKITGSVEMEMIRVLTRELRLKIMETDWDSREKAQSQLSSIEQVAALDGAAEAMQATVQMIRDEQQFQEIQLMIQVIFRSIRISQIRTKVGILLSSTVPVRGRDHLRGTMAACAQYMKLDLRAEMCTVETRSEQDQRVDGLGRTNQKSRSAQCSRKSNVFQSDDCSNLYSETLKNLEEILKDEELCGTEDRVLHAVLKMLVWKALSNLQDSTTAETFKKIEALMKTSVKRLCTSCHLPPLDLPLMDLLAHRLTMATCFNPEETKATVRHSALLLAQEGQSILAIRDVLEMHGGKNFLLHTLWTMDENVNLSKKMTTKYNWVLQTVAEKSRYWRNDEWKKDAIAVLKGGNSYEGLLLSDNWNLVWNEAQLEICDAVLAQNLEMVQFCTKRGAAESRGQAWSALHLATSRGQHLVVSYLLSRGANTDVRDGHGNTPLHLAAQEGHTEVMKSLLNCSARVDAVNEQHLTALHMAAWCGHLEATRLLIDHGAGIESATKNGFTPLFFALHSSEMVKYFLESGANANARNKANATPLHEAAHYGHDDSLHLLLGNGASLHALDNSHGTPFHMAVTNGHVAAVQALLEHGATTDEVCRSKWTLMHHAAANGHLDILQILLQKGGSGQTAGENNVTPLHLAALHGHLEIVKILLESGAELDAASASRWTPVHCAAINGHLDVLRFLLEKGANVNVVDMKQRTPLHYAALRGSTHISRTLLKCGAKASAVDYKRQTALHLSAKKGAVQIVQGLLRRKVAINLEDRKGRTAIMRAAKRGHEHTCKLLMDGGATYDAEDINRLLHRKPMATGSSAQLTSTNDRTSSGNLEKMVKDIIMQSARIVAAAQPCNAGRLHRAVRDENHHEVSRLMDNGHQVDVLDNQQWAPLHVAAAQNDVDRIALLLDSGATVDIRGLCHFTPLHIAALLGHVDAAKFLMERGADFRMISSWMNRTAVHLATDAGHGEVIRTLADQGATVDVADKDGNTPLHLAVGQEDVATAIALIETGANLKRTNKGQQTPLHVAAVKGHGRLVHVLLEHGAPVDARNAEGCTPLYIAVQQGLGPIVACLLKKGANVNVQNVERRTPVHVAAQLDDPEILQQLLAKGAIVNIPNKDQWTALHEAASIGQDVNVGLILEAVADIDAVESMHQTALHLATKSGHRPTVSRLLENGASVDQCDQQGLTALLLAIQSQNVAITQLLVENGASVNYYNQRLDVNPLSAAISSRQPDMVKLLLQSGARVNGRNANQNTPLSYTAFLGYAEVAEVLLEHGAAIDAGDKQNNTPLHAAAQEGHLEVMEVLLNRGANANALCDTNRTPLHQALQNGHPAIVDLLLRHGANVAAPLDNHLSPLHCAVRNGDARSVQILLEHGANQNASDNDYCNTPIHLATSHGHATIIQLLIQNGADVNVVDSKLATPLHLATERNRLDIVQILLNNGASTESRDENNLTALHVAAKYDESGHVTEALLAFDAEVNASDNDNCWTPLHFACRFGHTGSVAALLENGANVNIADKTYCTPLHIASGKGYLHVIQILLHYGADVHAQNAEGLTALHEAAGEGHVDVVKTLAGFGAEVMATTYASFWTPLHLAAYEGHCDVVADLVHRGASVDAVLRGGSTPLYLAAYEGHSGVVEILLHHGASVLSRNANRSIVHAAVNSDEAPTVLLILAAAKKQLGQGWNRCLDVANGDGDTPLMMAAKTGKAIAAEILLEHGAQMGTRNNGMIALHWAAQNGHHHILKMLAVPSLIDEPNSDGDTPLHLSCQQGHLEVVNLLIASRANVNSRNGAKFGPLHTAAENGSATIVEVLIRAGAEVEACDNEDRYTPLHLAAMEGHAQVARLLLQNGAPVDPLLSNGFTALYLAAQNGHKEVVQALLNGGASSLNGQGPSGVLHASVCSKAHDVVQLILSDVTKRKSRASFVIDAPDSAGDTPLMWAAEAGTMKTAKLLLGFGANVHLRNRSGSTALHWAAKNGHHQVVQLLLKYRADRTLKDEEGKRPIELAITGLDKGHNVTDYQKTIQLLLK